MSGPKFAAEQKFTDGTIEQVDLDGNRVGYTGQLNGELAFLWIQTELYAKSDFHGDAYSMSIPLKDKLADMGVNSIYVFDAESWITLDDIADGEELHKDDSFFNEEPDYDQLIVYVESWK